MSELEENALIFLKDREFEKAAKLYLQLALDNPTVDKYLISAANCYDRLGDKKTSMYLYKKAIQVNPQSLTALINLSTTYFEIGQYDKSELYAEKVLQVNPNNFAATLNLANVCYAREEFTQALAYYEKLYEENSNSYNLVLNIARTNYNLTHFVKAIEFANFAIEKRPTSAEAYVIAGNSFLELANEAQASVLFKQAVKLEPDSEFLCNSLANMFQKMGNWKQALHYAWKLFQIKQDRITAEDHINFGYILYEAKEEKQEELTASYLQLWEEGFPDNPIVKHVCCALNNVQILEKSDLSYVKSIFEGFAPSFDEILSELEYKVPTIIGELLRDNLKAKIFKKKRILDMGCGTGLCTEELKKYFPNEEFYGVDVCVSMLKEAEQKNIYKSLVEDDLVNYLEKNDDPYQVLVAGDVLTYIGDLKEVFSLLVRNLEINGLFCFSISKNVFNNNDYFLTPSGRFVHTLSYVLRLLKYIGFAKVEVKEAILRKEGSYDVNGYVILARKEIEVVFE